MKIAKEITVDWYAEKVYVDGERFELWLHPDGPRVTAPTEPGEPYVVHLPVLADEVASIGKAPK